MNRKELLRLLLNQAQFNGFEFRRWFQSDVRPVCRALRGLCPSGEEDVTLLCCSLTNSPPASGGLGLI